MISVVSPHVPLPHGLSPSSVSSCYSYFTPPRFYSRWSPLGSGRAVGPFTANERPIFWSHIPLALPHVASFLAWFLEKGKLKATSENRRSSGFSSPGSHLNFCVFVSNMDCRFPPSSLSLTQVMWGFVNCKFISNSRTSPCPWPRPSALLSDSWIGGPF